MKRLTSGGAAVAWARLLPAVLFLSAPVMAQQDEGDTDERRLEEIIVTGTHIEGLSEEVLPVTVMDEAAIQNTGAVNMQDILSYIPSISDFQFEDSNNGTNGARGDVAAVNMRGLGSGNTLVLLNGRRMVTHPVAQTVNSVPVVSYNVNSIPSAAVQRVEVLRDGAAPLYGADAIAGVVNFVPYTGYDGIKVSGKYAYNDTGSYDEAEFQAAGGFSFNDGRSKLGLFGTFYERGHVPITELGELYFELDRRQLDAIPESWRGDSQLRNTSTRTPWATFQTGQLLADGSWSRTATHHIDPETGAVEGGSLSRSFDYNFNETAWVTSDNERFNMMVTFNHELANGMGFFADAFYYDSSSEFHRAASPIDDGLAFLIVPPDSFHNPFPGEEVLITRWRPIDLGPRIINVDNESWRVMGGLRGEFGEWNWESALVMSEAENIDAEGNRQAKSLFIEALNIPGPDALNPFVGPGGNSQSALDAIRISSRDRRESELNLWDFRLNRDSIFQTFGNDVGLALGVEWREEAYVDDRDPRLDGSMPFSDGIIFDESDIIGVSATFDSSGSRDTYSTYAELFIPLIGEANAKPLAKAFEVQLAARYEDPSDFSSNTKPKIGFRWAPVEALSIRASYTEGFRAPNLLQLNQGTIVRRLQGIEDPLREDVTGSALDSGDTYRVTTRLGNPELQPEDAETTLFGFVFAPTNGPLEGFRIGADFWNIETESAVGIIDNDDQMDLDLLLRTQGSFNPDVIRAPITPADQALFDAWNADPANANDQRIPVGEATNIITQYENLDPRELEGWDAMAEYATGETRAGVFRIRGDMTKLTKFEQQGLATTDLLRRNGNPELRYTITLDWQYRDFNANLSVRFIDDVYDSSLSQSASSGAPGTVIGDTVYWEVDDWTVTNLTLRYDFGSRSDMLSGLRLSGGVRNLSDEQPPFADESFGYFRSLHNSYGRVLWAKADYEFN
jgi:outer membrane receptor protein involved in Fe transport